MAKLVAIDPNGEEITRDDRRPFKRMVIGKPSPYWALDHVKDAHRLASMYSSGYFLRYVDLGCHVALKDAMKNASAEERKGKYIDIRIVDLESRVSPTPPASAHKPRSRVRHDDSNRSDRGGNSAVEGASTVSGVLSDNEQSRGDPQSVDG